MVSWPYSFPLFEDRVKMVSSVLGNGRPSTARARDCQLYLSASILVMTCVAVVRLPSGKTPWDLMVQRSPSCVQTASPKVPSDSKTQERMRFWIGSQPTICDPWCVISPLALTVKNRLMKFLLAFQEQTIRTSTSMSFCAHSPIIHSSSLSCS